MISVKTIIYLKKEKKLKTIKNDKLHVIIGEN